METHNTSAPFPTYLSSSTTSSTSSVAWSATSSISSSSSSGERTATTTRLESLGGSMDVRTLSTGAVTTSSTTAAVTIAKSTVSHAISTVTKTATLANATGAEMPEEGDYNKNRSDILQRLINSNASAIEEGWSQVNKLLVAASSTGTSHQQSNSTASDNTITTSGSQSNDYLKDQLISSASAANEGFLSNWTTSYYDESRTTPLNKLGQRLGDFQSKWEDVLGGGIGTSKNSSSNLESNNPELTTSWLQSLTGSVQNLTGNLLGDPSSLFEHQLPLQMSHEEPMSLPLNLVMNDSYLVDHVNCSSFPGGENGSDVYGACGNETGLAGPEVIYNYWALLLIVFPVFTAFGNALVILSVKRERTLHNVTNYFIVSLAVADLLVAAIVMPFAVYFLLMGAWSLPPIFCDFYIGMDVVCSTSSICNLVAISIDRYIAVTQPIKYAKHKSNTRVWLTIAFVWIFSALVGSPIILGLNTPPSSASLDPFECAFNNKYFVLFSSLCSFYIPCAILVVLYYRIFKVIRERAKKAVGGGSCGGGGGRKPGGNPKGGTVIENLAQTKRLAETALGGPSSIPPPKSNNVDDEKLTNTGSGSQDDADDLEKEDMDPEDASPDSDDCHIIPNSQATGGFALGAVKEEKNVPHRGNVEPNGNHDSGYAASNMGDALAPGQEPSPASPKLSLVVPPDQCKRNGLSLDPVEGEPIALVSPGEASTGSNKKPASRFTICKVHKASRKKREKSSAKRERKATKTLAIVLGLFLICWLPFFTCNIMDALCTILNKDCSPGLVLFLTTTWLGYVNSCLNPVIYTIFNPEFRKAFKKIMGFAT